MGDAPGGLMVSALASRSRCPCSSPGRVVVLCSWARHFTLTVPLSTQEYKWALPNCQGNQTKCWGVTCDGLASHPGGVAILLASCYGNWDKLWLRGPDFTFYFNVLDLKRSFLFSDVSSEFLINLSQAFIVTSLPMSME